jgi:hypothetical protein
VDLDLAEITAAQAYGVGVDRRDLVRAERIVQEGETLPVEVIDELLIDLIEQLQRRCRCGHL